ncbi:MAG: ATP-binding protein [Pseudomonadota bacterium]
MTDVNVESRLQQLAGRLLSFVPESSAVDWQRTPAAAWREHRLGALLVAAPETPPIRLHDLNAVGRQQAALVQNTEQFLAGLPANNALLWGSRGAGKSSLIHALLNEYFERGLRLVQVEKTALRHLHEISARVADEPYRFILFCDDLSFAGEEDGYKVLKSALEGTVAGAAGNCLVYATSNRRHLLPEYATDNQRTEVRDGELHESEAVEEKISLSDRFGLWLSFYPMKQADYLETVQYWLQQLLSKYESTLDVPDLGSERDPVRIEALAWARARGGRSGRAAHYFARHWVGSRLLDQR